MNNDFSLKSCVTCGTLTKFRCHCYTWGYDMMAFCSNAACKADHLKEHAWMNPLTKKKQTEDETPKEPRKNNVKISSFPVRTEKTTKAASPGPKDILDETLKMTDDVIGENDKEPGAIAKPTASSSSPSSDKKEKGPLLIISEMTPRQKSRKANDTMKMCRETLSELKLLRPPWNFILRTVSTDITKKIDKKWSFSSELDVNENAISSRVKRRFRKLVQGLRVVEALRPDIMFELTTEKPKGSGKSKSHQYKSEKIRPGVMGIEDVTADAPDDIETNVEVEEDEDEEGRDLTDNTENVGECRFCKQVIKKEEVAIFCGTSKNLDDHFGAHTVCLGFIDVEKGDSFHRVLENRYRCPEHST